MKLSIIIVNWNVRGQLVKCLRSIEKSRPRGEFEIIVIDNASTDGSVEAVKEDFPGVAVIANNKNRGFAAANNQGIEKSQGQYILFLNPDTIVHPNSLDILVDFLDGNEDTGACGPKLLNSDGTTQPSARRFPSLRGALYRHTAFRFLRIFRSEYKKWMMKDFKYDRQIDVEQLMGSALMVRRSVLDQIGGIDETFFMYYEEVDLCYRMKQARSRIVFIPDAVITHLGGCSSKQIPAKKQIMTITSLLNFFRKHRGNFVTMAFNFVFKPAIILREVCNVVTGTVTYAFAVLVPNKRRRNKSASKVKNSASMLGKYSRQLFFKM